MPISLRRSIKVRDKLKLFIIHIYNNKNKMYNLHMDEVKQNAGEISIDNLIGWATGKASYDINALINEDLLSGNSRVKILLNVLKLIEKLAYLDNSEFNHWLESVKEHFDGPITDSEREIVLAMRQHLDGTTQLGSVVKPNDAAKSIRFQKKSGNDLARSKDSGEKEGPGIG